MSANRLSLYWISFIIMSICAVFCAFLALSKMKIVRWEFFYPGQQKWAKKQEAKLNMFVKRFFLIISIIYCLVGTLPSCLNLPYVLTADYKKADGIVSKKSGMFIYLKSGERYRVGKVDWCKTGDCIQLAYLPFTRYATITNVTHSSTFCDYRRHDEKVSNSLEGQRL